MNVKHIGIFLLLAIGFSPSYAVTHETIRFAPLPMENDTAMTREYLPFMSFLENNLKSTSIKLVYKKSYQDLITSFKNNEIDIAYLGPLPYVVLKEQFPKAVAMVQFLDAEGKSTYTCSLVKFAGNQIQLTNKVPLDIALTQPLSTCGYLATESLLNKHGLTLEQPNVHYEYIGNHTKVAENVILGKQQLGGLKTQIGKRYHHLGLRIIQETDPMPGFLLVANADTLSAEKIKQITSLILSIKPIENANDFETTKLWGDKIKYGAIPANDSLYNSVREKWKQTKIDLMTQ